jgi:ATP-dependent DNA ligase
VIEMPPSVPRFDPMRLDRRREPFDDPAWIFELKFDGFRSVAFVTGGATKLVSRRGHQDGGNREACNALQPSATSWAKVPIRGSD